MKTIAHKLLRTLLLASLATAAFAVPASGAEGTVNGNIAYLNGLTSTADGRNATFLPGGLQTITAAEFSPDGSRLALAMRNLKGNGALYVGDADGSDRKRITPNSATVVAAHWTPDGSRLIYLADRDGTAGAEVYSAAADGSGEIQLAADATDLTQERNNGFDPIESPSFSVVGGKIAYATAAEGGDSEIVVMDLDGANKLPLTADSIDDLQPVLSPDASTVLFTRITDSSTAQVMRIGVDGSGLTALTAPDEYSSGALFTPDGSRVVYNAGDTIRAMNPDGTANAEVLPSGRSGFVVGVSPDSKRVVYDFINFGPGEDFTVRAFSVLLSGGDKDRLVGQFGDWQALDAPAPTPELSLTATPGRTSSQFVPQVRVECSNECDVKVTITGRLGGSRIKEKAKAPLRGNSSSRIDLIGEKEFRKEYRGDSGKLTVKVLATDAFGQKDRAKTKLKVS